MCFWGASAQHFNAAFVHVEQKFLTRQCDSDRLAIAVPGHDHAGQGRVYMHFLTLRDVMQHAIAYAVLHFAADAGMKLQGQGSATDGTGRKTALHQNESMPHSVFALNRCEYREKTTRL